MQDEDQYITVEGSATKWECRLLTYDSKFERYTPETLSKHMSETSAYDAALIVAKNRGLEVRL